MANSSSDHLLKHSALLMAAQQFGNVCTAGFQFVMGRTLSGEDFSILATLLGVTVIAGVPMDAVRTAVAHFSSRLLQEDRLGDVRVLIRQWVLYMCVLAIPIVLIGFAFTSSLAGYFHLDRGALVILTALSIAATFYKFPVLGALQGLQEFLPFAITSHSWAFFRLLLGAVLVYFVSRTALPGLVSQFAASLIAVLIGVAYLYGLLRGTQTTVRRVIGVRRYVLRSFFVLAGFAVLMTGDIVLVRHYLPGESDMYARASTIGRSVIFFSQPIAAAMFPKVTSAGSTSSQNRATLFRAIFYSGLCIVAVVAVLSAFPRFPLLVMFKLADPTIEEVQLLRYVMWAMSPLGLVFLLMNFELAQHRFGATTPLVLCAVGFIVGVHFFHASLNQAVLCLAVASGAALFGLLFGLPWRNAGASPPVSA